MEPIFDPVVRNTVFIIVIAGVIIFFFLKGFLKEFLKPKQIIVSPPSKEEFAKLLEKKEAQKEEWAKEDKLREKEQARIEKESKIKLDKKLKSKKLDAVTRDWILHVRQRGDTDENIIRLLSLEGTQIVIERWDRERETQKMMKKIDLAQKKEGGLAEKIESKLSPEQLDLRKRMIKLIDYYGLMRIVTDYTEEGAGEEEWGPRPGSKDEMDIVAHNMKPVMDNLKLKNIKKLLTADEFTTFLPFYIKLREKGKFSTFHMA